MDTAPATLESSAPFVAFMFEGGGNPGSPLEADMQAVRRGIALDTLGFLVALQRLGELDRVVLVTDQMDLAERGGALGVIVDTDASRAPFHFVESLGQVITRHGARSALVLGGAAAPLYGLEEFREFLWLCRSNPGAVVLNNPQSPDVLAFHPAEAALSIHLTDADSDNALGQALVAAGLRRLLVENSACVNFDVDTPTDCAILDGEAGRGRCTREALDGLGWLPAIRRKLEAVEGVLGAEGGELALFGRVGPPVTSYINLHLRCRLRVFSEERGMRALGRVHAGTAVSLMGFLMDEVGPERFFAHLGATAHAALMDTRVLFAHWKRPFSDADRFHADIGRTDAVIDPQLAAFAAAAWEAPLPVVCGGHTLIYGGLWLLTDRVLRRMHPLGA